MKRKCYIARYPLSTDGKNLDEIILFRDTYYSPAIREKWDELIDIRKPSDPMLQCWYADSEQVECMAQTNQPFKLD
jgi:hypothetical protein